MFSLIAIAFMVCMGIHCELTFSYYALLTIGSLLGAFAGFASFSRGSLFAQGRGEVMTALTILAAMATAVAIGWLHGESWGIGSFILFWPFMYRLGAELAVGTLTAGMASLFEAAAVHDGPQRPSAPGGGAVRRLPEPSPSEKPSVGRSAPKRQQSGPASSEARQPRVRVHLLNPACRVLPPILPLPAWIDPEIYTVAEWTVGRDVSLELAKKWLDRDTRELYAIRMLRLQGRDAGSPRFEYGDPEFVTRAEWEKQAAEHDVVPQRKTPGATKETAGSPAAQCSNSQGGNRRPGSKILPTFRSLPSHLRAQSCALFQKVSFSADSREEFVLFLLDDPEFARELGRLDPFHLAAKCGVVRTSAGMIAFIIWTVSSRNGHVVDYEHPLDSFKTKTLQMLCSIAEQGSLKVIILNSFSSKTEGVYEFTTDFKLKPFAKALTMMKDWETQWQPPPDFNATQAALRREFSLEDLKNG